jgi:hypothetical protein
MLLDETGAGLPLRPAFAASLNLWKLIAASAGRQVVVAAEWDGEWAEPIGLIDEASKRFCDLAPRWAA